ncbi:MAG: hypothetical protein AAF662_04405 [Pseudomonadota bacterium]
MTTPNIGENTLADLRSNDPSRVKLALENLTDELVNHARSKLRGRQNNVVCQPESVVQSVLARELGHGAEAFDNESHLQGRLRRAVLNKISDRLKGPKGRTGQLSQHSEERSFEPARDDAGVATHVVDSETAAWLENLLTEGLKTSDQLIVRLWVLEDHDVNDLAKQVSLKPAAIRQRMTRLRPALRKRLLEPIRSSLSAHEWAVVNACLIERLDPQAASLLLGITPEQMANTLEEIMREKLSPAIGDAGVTVLGRLLGRAKAPSV